MLSYKLGKMTCTSMYNQCYYHLKEKVQYIWMLHLNEKRKCLDCKAKISCYLSISQYIKLIFTHTTAMMSCWNSIKLRHLTFVKNRELMPVYLTVNNMKTIERICLSKERCTTHKTSCEMQMLTECHSSRCCQTA